MLNMLLSFMLSMGTKLNDVNTSNLITTSYATIEEEFKAENENIEEIKNENVEEKENMPPMIVMPAIENGVYSQNENGEWVKVAEGDGRCEYPDPQLQEYYNNLGKH